MTTISELKDSIVRKLGLEHPETIWFFTLCENHPTANFDYIYGGYELALCIAGIRDDEE